MYSISAFNYEITRSIRSHLSFLLTQSRFEELENWLSQHATLYGELIKVTGILNIVFRDLKILTNDERFQKTNALFERYIR